MSAQLLRIHSPQPLSAPSSPCEPVGMVELLIVVGFVAALLGLSWVLE